MAVAGRFNNNGQSCIASKRFIAVAMIGFGKFTDKSLKVGDQWIQTLGWTIVVKKL
jgi:succinate-semialdehyde dehydrogenase/glutarate-semialdehyde dehydrogenase